MTNNCIMDDYKKGGCASCPAHCGIKIAIKARQDYSKIPLDYVDKTLKTANVRETQTFVFSQMTHYADTFERQFTDHADHDKRIKSLYLYSAETGTGKTTTAAVVLNEWIMRSYIGALKRGETPHKKPAYFLDVNEWQTLYNKFNRPGVPQEVAEKNAAEYYERMERAKRAPFAVLDDIGIRSATEPFRADLHEIINHRTVQKLPTVYTSNVKIKDLESVFDRRLADRVRDMCIVYTFEGESKRGKRAE